MVNYILIRHDYPMIVVRSRKKLEICKNRHEQAYNNLEKVHKKSEKEIYDSTIAFQRIHLAREYH